MNREDKFLKSFFTWCILGLIICIFGGFFELIGLVLMEAICVGLLYILVFLLIPIGIWGLYLLWKN